MTGFDYSNDKNIDNLYGQEFLEGYYAEMKDPKNVDKTIDQLKEIVRKELLSEQGKKSDVIRKLIRNKTIRT